MSPRLPSERHGFIHRSAWKVAAIPLKLTVPMKVRQAVDCKSKP